MKARITLWVIFGIFTAFTGVSFAGTLAGAKVYIAPQSNGFDVSLAAAMVKKHVPITVVGKLSDAQYKLESTSAQRFTSTGSKVARCLFADCIGIGGQRTDSVELVDMKTSEVVWAYNVRKAANGKQSAAEAVAKHLRNSSSTGSSGASHRQSQSPTTRWVALVRKETYDSGIRAGDNIPVCRPPL